jgi:glutathione S-transferase
MGMQDGAPEPVELLQFPFSHFNEKARWALDWKGVPHRRTNLLPGPHALTVLRLTGKTEVPVLRAGGEVIGGSAAIIDALERRAPTPALYPADPGARTRALELQQWFDDEVGPMVRRALFAVMLDTPSYVCGMFAGHRSWGVRAAYRATFPVVSSVMKRSMGITDAASVERAGVATQEAFDFVARQAGPSGYLVGETFTVADLAAAALLAPVVDVPHPDMRKPTPRPAAMQAVLDRWAEHPGAAWVQAHYRQNRPPAQAALAA